MLRWLRARRRRKILGSPVPAMLEPTLRRRVAVYSRMPEVHRQRLLDLTRVFAAEKAFEGGQGFAVTDEVRWVIAAQACLLLLGLVNDPHRDPVYPNVRTIIVYPSGFMNPMFRVAGPGGVVGEGSANLGEAHHRGPVIVSWLHSAAGGAEHADGHNLVLHEFAHKLDMLDDVVDGTPPLSSTEQYACWRDVMTASYRQLINDARSGHATVLDTYGSTNPGEFFAVATEAFFEKALELRARHAELYGVLKCYYRQDPAEWA